jgi:4-amino-4-deoxy-L-arabinose transferase-like glycosyltransferase
MTARAGARWRGVADRAFPTRPYAAAAAVTALAVFVWFAFTAGLRPLMLPDEGRYVGVAWEMLRSGDWLTPTLDGLPYFHKPPLFYWITASSLGLFGLNEWAARLAPVLGATIGTLALHGFARRWAGERQARATLVALLAQPLVFIGGQFANLDMLVAGCITATVVLLAHAALSVESGRPDRRALLAAYGMAALGMLAKGLIGFVLPALVIGAWLAARGRWRTLRALWSWPGAGIFLLLGAPWFVAMQLRFPDFLDYFFVVQHFKRFAAAGFNNVEPFWFYPALLVLFCLPWAPWLLRLLRRPPAAPGAAGSLRLLMGLWVGVVVLFFSLPASKLVGYVLPALPPLAFLIADGYTAAATGRLGRRLWIGGAVLAIVLNGVAVGWLSMHPLKSSRALALALLERQRGSEPVVMLEDYRFDVPFYAALRRPVVVVDAWSSPDIARHDNWRKEFADAAAFAPAQAATTLIERSALPKLLCAAPTSWLLGANASTATHPFLAAAQRVATQGGTSLWRVDARAPAVFSALGCEGRPSVGSAGR